MSEHDEQEKGYTLRSVGFNSQIRLGNGGAPHDGIYLPTHRANGTRVDNGPVMMDFDAESGFLLVKILKSGVKQMIPISNISYLMYDQLETFYEPKAKE